MGTGADIQLLISPIRDNVVGSDDTICSSEVWPGFSCLEYIANFIETIKEGIDAQCDPKWFCCAMGKKIHSSQFLFVYYKFINSVL